MSTLDVSDLRSTIVPKSDQLNAEQLLGDPMTVSITDVRIGSGAEQPINVHYEGENGRPYKPCKTMRKVLIFAWGPDGREWIGRSLTLYNDPQVKFGGDEVGGIRISHMTNIERDVQVSLTATRGKKALHTIKRLAAVRGPSVDDIKSSPTVDALKDNFGAAYKATKDTAVRARLKSAYDARMAALTKPAKTLEQFKADVDSAEDAALAQIVLDEARDVLTPSEVEELQQAYDMAWSE